MFARRSQTSHEQPRDAWQGPAVTPAPTQMERPAATAVSEAAPRGPSPSATATAATLGHWASAEAGTAGQRFATAGGGPAASPTYGRGAGEVPAGAFAGIGGQASAGAGAAWDLERPWAPYQQGSDSKAAGTPLPPEHQVQGAVQEKRAQVFLKDTNYTDEELGHWDLNLRIGVDQGGQVYLVEPGLVTPRLKSQAQKALLSTPQVISTSVNEAGARSLDILFRVEVAEHMDQVSTTKGISIATSNGLSLGAGVSVDGVAVNGEVNSDMTLTQSGQKTQATTSQGRGVWARAFRATAAGAGQIALQEDQGRRMDIEEGQLVIDSSKHNGWGVDTDWDLSTYSK